MALAGRLLSSSSAHNFNLELLCGLVHFVLLGSVSGSLFSDEQISGTVVGGAIIRGRNYDSALDSANLLAESDIRLFAEDFAGQEFHQLALTESVKDKGDACSIRELRSVPLRTIDGVVSVNFSSVDALNGLDHARAEYGGCTTSFHLCASKVQGHKRTSNWIHLGKQSVIDIGRPCSTNDAENQRRRRQATTGAAAPAAAPATPAAAAAAPAAAAAAAGDMTLSGLRVEASYKPPDMADDGVISVLQEREVTLRLFGARLTDGLQIKFTGERLERGASCERSQTTVAFELKSVDAAASSGLLTVVLPQLPPDADTFYLCAQPAAGGPYVHLGDARYLTVGTFPPLLPVPVHVILLVCLLCLSGLFSGLNLGLMALNITELKLVLSTGTDNEKRSARTIIPVRNHGNYLLCTLLLGNVLVNSSLTILLDELTSGIVAVIGSTLGIVIFGEIVPQALCSRHGLAVGAKTIYLTKLFMVVTSPLSYPISLILDRVLGEEIGNTYNRDRLKELIKLNKDDMGLENEEQNMIVGALDLKAKTVSDVMTPLEDVYMLPYDSFLDYQTISEIMEQGYSRIPVYEGDRSNIVAVMLAKDMAFVDPDDCTPIKTLCHFYQNPWSFVFEDVTLDVMLREFKEGIKGHMAFVQRVVTETVGDPYYELVGLVTLEDVIEEMIQAEIVDETDVLTDNRTKKRRGKKRRMPDPIAFAQPSNNQIHISPQLALATFQFLQTVEPFKNELICPSVLKKLLERDVVRHIKPKDDKSLNIYERNKPVDFFCMILEGRVRVTMGKENLAFESGPFSYFGTQALVMPPPESEASPQLMRGSVHSLDGALRPTFIPEYCVRAISEVFYLKIRRSHYVAARKATLVAAQLDPSRPLDAADSLAQDMGSRTDSMRDFHLNPTNTVSRPGGDSSATLVSLPAADAADAGSAPPAAGAGSDTEQSEMSSLLSVPTTPSGRHVNFVEVRQRSASHPSEAAPAENGAAADEPNSAAV